MDSTGSVYDYINLIPFATISDKALAATMLNAFDAAGIAIDSIAKDDSYPTQNGARVVAKFRGEYSFRVTITHHFAITNTGDGVYTFTFTDGVLWSVVLNTKQTTVTVLTAMISAYAEMVKSQENFFDILNGTQ